MLPDDDECHRGKMKANVVLKFMEIHCDSLSRPKQKYKRNLREEEKICVKNKNVLLDIVQIEECENLPQIFERIARSAYEMWSWMRIPSGNDTKEQSEVECIKMRFANEDI